ncbi:aldehyde dehydrogenase family protein [Streptomyces sp. NPDC056948]|uniref:aldehyde dehydrogenase family protein n=1 Tax=Streptomyces sp. NPDC056948 TaxID=3345975 RepID=UPI0036D3E42F
MGAARSAGAHIHTGGLPHGRPSRGAYYSPTVISRAPAGSDVLTRQVFVTVQTFTSENEAVRMASERHRIRARRLGLDPRPRSRVMGRWRADAPAVPSAAVPCRPPSRAACPRPPGVCGGPPCRR